MTGRQVTTVDGWRGLVHGPRWAVLCLRAGVCLVVASVLGLVLLGLWR